MTKRLGLKQWAAALALSCSAVGGAQAAAVITIVNANEPGVGFNDPTPTPPVGGNLGGTLGQQRLIAFQRAADIWGATLTSNVPIRVMAAFEPLECTADSAVLGSAGAWSWFAEVPGVPHPNAWYPSALASKITGADLAQPDEPHIFASFNSRLGLAPDCMPGSGFYLGLDSNHGAQLDLVTVLLHELGHGLGFQTVTDGASGEQALGRPTVWDYYLVNNANNRVWAQMTDAERAASAISGRGLSWNGPIVTAAVPQVLSPASILLIRGRAGSAIGNYDVGDASFGPPLGKRAVKGQLVQLVDQPDGTGLACAPLNRRSTHAVRNNIVLVDRGTCPYTQKARNVQQAGAIGMIVADNAPGEVAGMPGTDRTIRIPSVRITQADGVKIKGALKHRSRRPALVYASLGLDLSRLAGADAQRRILMYTPTVHSDGSSVSHFTTEAKPNQLMEPFINDGLPHVVTPPRDLTFPLLRDIGW